eukprot:3698569-Rhodomonas_salina.1
MQPDLLDRKILGRERADMHLAKVKLIGHHFHLRQLHVSLDRQHDPRPPAHSDPDLRNIQLRGQVGAGCEMPSMTSD